MKDKIMDIEHCDVCKKALNINKGEDFFVETENGSLVFCEVHWIDYERGHLDK